MPVTFVVGAKEVCRDGDRERWEDDEVGGMGEMGEDAAGPGDGEGGTVKEVCLLFICSGFAFALFERPKALRGVELGMGEFGEGSMRGDTDSS
jgi:hypothetical protein